MTNEKEMKIFLGIFFAVTQVSKKLGIKSAFYECSDGFFLTPNRGKFGLKHWHFKELFSYSTYASIDDGDNEDQADYYWATDQRANYDCSSKRVN